MLVYEYSKQFIIHYAQFEHRSMLDLSVCDAVTWTTHKRVICVSACMRFYENTNRRLYYLCNSNAAVETCAPTSRSCTNSGHTKEWYMGIAVLYTFNSLCYLELSRSVTSAYVHSYK